MLYRGEDVISAFGEGYYIGGKGNLIYIIYIIYNKEGKSAAGGGGYIKPAILFYVPAVKYFLCVPAPLGGGNTQRFDIWRRAENIYKRCGFSLLKPHCFYGLQFLQGS